MRRISVIPKPVFGAGDAERALEGLEVSAESALVDRCRSSESAILRGF